VNLTDDFLLHEATDTADHAQQNPPQQPQRTGTVKSAAEIKQEKKERKNDRIIDALSTLFSNGATTGAFFAGFTLNIVVSADANKQTSVRLYSAVCSLLFVLLVLLCSAGSVVLAYYREEILHFVNGNKDAAPGWRKRHMWSIFGLLPTFLFTILSGGIIFLFLVMKAYENAVALAGLVAVGVGMFFGGIGWVMLLGNYFESPWKKQDKEKKEEKKRPPVNDDQA
jgi:hypothetical protein